ncbi:hypothetical protein CCHR01_08623 [Colletotrichum chrysophilum]|uniref:Uncharacterized protein n=1 Tax=Colletotrichum chrysophilum TaxID=1836956 RepID=A0AAD9EHL8_9PEZI|nr:hypothetical protein CCHR01_08623 [Colletotrichum chrysophilum]
MGLSFCCALDIYRFVAVIIGGAWGLELIPHHGQHDDVHVSSHGMASWSEQQTRTGNPEYPFVGR